MKKLYVIIILFGCTSLIACQGDGNINDTIEEDSVESIRLPEDNTEVDKTVDSTPVVNKDSLQADTSRNDNGRNKQ